MTQEAYVAVDVETAAQQAGSICQIGAAVFDADGDPVAGRRREMLVRPPDNLYGPEFSKYHGIKASDTKGAPSWETVAAEIAELMGGLPVVCHNAEYESEQFAAAAGTPPQLLDASLYCSLRLSRYTDPGEGKHSLEECARRYGLRRTGKKQALSDALLSGRLWAALVSKQGWTIPDSFSKMDALPADAGSWEWLQEKAPPTDRQVDFLVDLINESGAQVKAGGKKVRKRRDLHRLSRAEASRLIDRLKARRR